MLIEGSVISSWRAFGYNLARTLTQSIRIVTRPGLPGRYLLFRVFVLFGINLGFCFP